jgi:hypothetical protein
LKYVLLNAIINPQAFFQTLLFYMVKFKFTVLELVSKESALVYIPIIKPDVVKSHPVKYVWTIGLVGRIMLTVYKTLLFDVLT